MSDLCPCPICGKETKLQSMDFPDGETRFYVECADEKCGCGIYIIFQKKVTREFNADGVEVVKSEKVNPVYIPLTKRQAKIYSQSGGDIDQATHQNEVDAMFSWSRKIALWEAQSET